jgi:hypothetical protein
VDLEACDIEAVAIRIGYQVVGLREPGALPIVVRGDWVRLNREDGALEEPLEMNQAGLAVAGFSDSPDFAVTWVRYNLTSGAVIGVTRTRALLCPFPLPFRTVFITDEPVWLVQIDPTAWIEWGVRDEAHLAAPYARFDDPAADQPILGPGGNARLLRRVATPERQLLCRHRRNTPPLGIPADYDIPTTALYEAPWVPKLS